MGPSFRQLRHVLRLHPAVATGVSLKPQNLSHTRLHNRPCQFSIALLLFPDLSCSKHACHRSRPINKKVFSGCRSLCSLDWVAPRHASKNSLRVHDNDDECIPCFLCVISLTRRSYRPEENLILGDILWFTMQAMEHSGVCRMQEDL